MYYSLWLAEVGCAKVGCSRCTNIKAVFSGASRVRYEVALPQHASPCRTATTNTTGFARNSSLPRGPDAGVVDRFLHSSLFRSRPAWGYSRNFRKFKYFFFLSAIFFNRVDLNLEDGQAGSTC